MTEDDFKAYAAYVQLACKHQDIQTGGVGKLMWYRCRECGAVVENPHPVVIHKPMIVDPGQS